MRQLGGALALLLLLGAPRALGAQRRPAFDITPPQSATIGATVNASNLFGDAGIRDLVRSGFPASLHYRLELWRTGGLFDDLEGRSDWDIILQ